MPLQLGNKSSQAMHGMCYLTSSELPKDCHRTHASFFWPVLTMQTSCVSWAGVGGVSGGETGCGAGQHTARGQFWFSPGSSSSAVFASAGYLAFVRLPLPQPPIRSVFGHAS